MIDALFWLITQIIQLYVYVIFAQVILSWLIAFSVINTQNRFVYMLGDALYRATEPALRPIRRFLPSLGGIDLSPVALLLLLFFVQRLVHNLWRQLALG